jgi:hypothetical protein
LTRVTIRSKLGNPCRVRAGGRTADLKTEAGEDYTLNGELQ